MEVKLFESAFSVYNSVCVNDMLINNNRGTSLIRRPPRSYASLLLLLHLLHLLPLREEEEEEEEEEVEEEEEEFPTTPPKITTQYTLKLKHPALNLITRRLPSVLCYAQRPISELFLC